MARKHPFIRLLVFWLLFTTCCSAWRQGTKQKREARYETALQSYSDIFKPGATRKSLEEYLQVKGVEYEKTCCIDERSAFAELVRIGKEKHPWYCSEHNVFIEFQFVDESHEGWRPSDKALDKLKSITIYHRLDGCL